MGSILKAVFYFVFLGVLLVLLAYLFETVDFLTQFYQYLVYIQGALVIVLGYQITTSIADAVFKLTVEVSDRGTAGSLRTLIRIGGVAILLSVLTSIFKVNATAALTIGSFSGLVIGFATQNVLTQAVAGLFLALSRPFELGDEITVAGQTGVVKDIKIVQTVLKNRDGSKEILIPNNTIFGAIITRKDNDSEMI